ncbi:MAG: hypothetical protein Q4D62_12015 [Planctomycetia bacterium]|nr:hypothetical protein [Planctomycetia bacterium]
MSDESSEVHASSEPQNLLPEITQAKRKRLQQLFEHGTLQSNQGNFDYATELLTQCVLGEPGNAQYMSGYLTNLKKKYGNSRKGHPMAFFKMGGLKRAAKKAVQKEEWLNAFENGCKALQWNPWDVQVLEALIKTTQTLGFVEVPLLFLKSALESNPKDLEINRMCAVFLEELGRINDAYQCWRRILDARPTDDEAERNMARLSVARTINESGYTAAPTANANKRVTAKTGSGATVEMTHEQLLEQQIRQQPKNSAKYIELAEIYTQTENFEKAADVLRRAVESCGQVDSLQDRLEDIETRLMRQQLIAAEREHGKDSDEWRALRKKTVTKELEIWQSRCERNPNNYSFKYELGMRYQMLGNHDEAIKQFQMAKKEPRRRGSCCLALGQSFQSIKQYRLAMANYEEAIEEIPDRDADNKKRAYYLAGKLSMTMGEWVQADQFLARLADMDFSYRDVSELLEKVSQMRKKSE